MARQMKNSGIEWIGEIPAGWGVYRAKYLFQTGDGALRIGPFGSALSGKALAEGPYKIYNQAHLVSNDFSLCRHFVSEETYQDLQSYEVAPGDILFSMMGTIGKCRVMPAGQQRGIMDSHLLKARLNDLVIPRFFEYVYDKDLSPIGIGQLSHFSNGSIMAGLNSSIVKNVFFPLPTVAEQQRIADFLDRKCAEIDAVIERTKATIEEYKKLKQAVITEAVTKGVRGPRPMKDSGIEWIGEIPEEWDSSKLGGVTLSMRNGYVGPTRDLFFEAGIRYIQSLHIKDGVIDFGKHPYYVAEEWANEHPKVHTNDILIVQTGDIGQVGIVESEYDGCNCHALIIATPDCTLLFPRYLMFYLMSIPGKELLLSYKTGALLPHLNAGKIKFTPVLLPALDEQEDIVFYLDEKCAALDTLTAKKTALLTELETYKKSLIYEYVTGKKEVL